MGHDITDMPADRVEEAKMQISRTSFMLAAAFVALPWLLAWLQELDSEHGALWLLLHQLHYLPFSSLPGRAFFVPDSELGFIVTPMGRMFVACVYGLVVLVVASVVARVRRRRRSRAP
jgi:hypothetical protein